MLLLVIVGQIMLIEFDATAIMVVVGRANERYDQLLHGREQLFSEQSAGRNLGGEGLAGADEGNRLYTTRSAVGKMEVEMLQTNLCNLVSSSQRGTTVHAIQRHRWETSHTVQGVM